MRKYKFKLLRNKNHNHTKYNPPHAVLNVVRFSPSAPDITSMTCREDVPGRFPLLHSSPFLIRKQCLPTLGFLLPHVDSQRAFEGQRPGGPRLSPHPTS